MRERLGRWWRKLTWWPRHLVDRPRQYALATLTAALVIGSFPPFNIFPLMFIAFVPFIAVCEGTEKARHALGWAWWSGFVVNAGGFYFIVGLLRDFGYMPYIVSIPIFLLLCAQQGLIIGAAGGIGRWLRLHAGFPVAIAYVTGFLVSETLLQLIFPVWMGNSQYLNLAFVQSAELGGVALLTALVVLVNAALWEAWCWRRSTSPKRPRVPRTVIVAVVLVGLNYAYGMIRIPQIDARIEAAETLRVGLVEGDIGMYDKGDLQLFLDNLLRHQRMTQQLVDDGAELVVWPETMFESVRYYQALDDVESLEDAERYGRVMSYLDHDAAWLPPSDTPLPPDGESDRRGVSVRDIGVPQRGYRVPMLFGAVTRREIPRELRDELPSFGEGPRRWEVFNSAMLVDDEGRVLGVTDKIKLMPFSEHLPGGRWLYRTFGINLYRVVPFAGDFSPGDQPQVFELPREEGEAIRIGVMVCYEDIIPRYGREVHDAGPDVLINLTNDAWFGQTSEPEHHMALSVMRTIEQRTHLLRSTNTGISAVIDPVGRIIERTETVDPETILYDTPIMRAQTTLYMTLGNWPGQLAIFLLVATVIRVRVRRRAVPEPQPVGDDPASADAAEEPEADIDPAAPDVRGTPAQGEEDPSEEAPRDDPFA